MISLFCIKLVSDFSELLDVNQEILCFSFCMNRTYFCGSLFKSQVKRKTCSLPWILSLYFTYYSSLLILFIEKKPCFRYFKEELQQVSVRVEPTVPYCDILIRSPPSYNLDVAVTQGFSDPQKCTISYAAERGGEIAEMECNVQVLAVPEDRNRLYYAVHHLRDGNRKAVVLNVTPVKSTRK